MRNSEPTTQATGHSGQQTLGSLGTSHFDWWRLWLLAACVIVPLGGFGVAGALWFYQRGWLGWAGLVLLCGEALAYCLFRRWSRTEENVLLPQPPQTPPAEFSPRDEEAWRLVRTYQERIDRREITLTSLEQLLSLGQEIFERVATFYRPGEPEPLFAVQVPLLLRAIEETARDLATVTANVPFAHRITISDLMRGYRVGQKLKPVYDAYQFYRFLSPLINWQTALFRIFVTDRLFDLTRDTVNQWLLRWYVDRVGYHAIALYSGKLLLTQRIEGLPPLSESTAEMMTEVKTQKSEPLRVLIIGQVKAGKSSLVNALFGEVRAATDVVPTTVKVTHYLLERPDLEGAVIVADMGGYEDPSLPKERIEEVCSEALHSDLIVLVISSVNAARESDRRLLTQLREHFRTRPELSPPPVIVVLTHIDRLRPPLEWTPPYNVVNPDSPKARSIRGALEAVAADLGLAPEVIVPVCLQPERLYNVEEGLIPLLVEALPTAKRTLLLRTLQTLREREKWQLLGHQARATGQFLLQIGKEVVRKSLKRVLTDRRL
jgi:predicted GTPase